MKTSILKKGISIMSLAGLLMATPAVSGGTAAEPQADPRIPENVNLLQRYEWTRLHWAARHGQTSVVNRLLEEGAEIDRREQMGRTPLHLAAMANHRDTAELLISRGADVNARDRWGVTPLRRMELLREVRNWNRSDIKNLLTDSGGIR